MGRGRSVFEATRARTLLRDSGEAGGIVGAETDFSATKLASLKFVVFAVLAPLPVISIFLLARDLGGN